MPGKTAPALCVQQPFAGWIATGIKTIEVRSWRTAYRGPLLIVASRKPATHGPSGVVVCQVDLADCRAMTPADQEQALCQYQPDDFAWVLEHLVPCEPLPTPRGHTGIFNLQVGGDLKPISRHEAKIIHAAAMAALHAPAQPLLF